MRLQRQEQLTGLLFALPYALGMLVLVILPLLAVWVISGTSWSLLDEPRWVGLNNYQQLLHDPSFYHSLTVTVLFTVGILALNLSSALGLAVLLNQKLRGIALFRTIIFSPVVMPVVAWALVWKFLLQPEGPINQILASAGVRGPNWLFEPSLALWLLVVIEVIKAVGLNTVIFLSALQGVPKEMHEAAMLDGATPVQAFFRISLPLISPTMFLVFIVTLIGALKLFTPVFVLTGGGPAGATTTLILFMYKQGFSFFEFGYASTVAVVLFVVVLGLTVLQWNLRKRLVFYEN
ncbi:binding-protein-dependent transport systems inner membrane component (plasmid) [Allomeiothermus silvanus DSM 9946]|uniref:Binding-protein-dependent transport systems inner membrane component n=1 Tax=Allomeiothermus silvanus (strain ATCC 700542 / DSM 9946 / NBRC 106475 / NCIMB 13440 / VI-R2) TaxID=526227 RepID=D7BJ49_ALLS1|nr:sugar ABC transporter permease [Allomeiothermus silvanus]ADH65205.1 binding-protein-dependent transport systems inner membrane component [Allomeiothermus silvanus DSM 9946]